MQAEDKLSVLNRNPTQDDREYWSEVATHIVGILGTAAAYKFTAWMIRTPGSIEYYMIGEQARVTLIQKFRERQ
jgi:hypothetical protein